MVMAVQPGQTPKKKICGKYSRLKFDLFNGKLAFKYEKSFNSSVEINNYIPES